MGISKIWVYGESTDGVVTTSTLELLAKARTIAETVEVVVYGDASAVAAELGEHGASTVRLGPGRSNRRRQRPRCPALRHQLRRP